MKIQLLIRRKAGSTVVAGGTKYVFNDENDHTCEVDDDDLAARLLEQEPRVFVEVEQSKLPPVVPPVSTTVSIPAAGAVEKKDSAPKAETKPKATRKPRAPKAEAKE